MQKAVYSQNWPAYTKAQINEGEMFMQLLASLCKSVKQPEYKFGRPTKPIADMVFCTALKVYSTFSLRRFMSMMKIAKERGYIDDMCSFTSVSNYMLKEEMEDTLLDMIHKSSLPLASVENDFAADSTGFSTSVYARWFNFKYGKMSDKRKWWKLHVMCGVKTNIVTAAIVTDSRDNDSPMFKYLMDDTNRKFRMKEVSADKAYSSRENMELVDDRGAVPYIPFKSNTSGKSRGSYMWRKMYHYFMYNQEEFLRHYHKRSNVESTMNMIKSKFDTFVRSKNDQSQKNEILAKVLCHNICVLIQEMYKLNNDY